AHTSHGTPQPRRLPNGMTTHQMRSQRERSRAPARSGRGAARIGLVVQSLSRTLSVSPPGDVNEHAVGMAAMGNRAAPARAFPAVTEWSGLAFADSFPATIAATANGSPPCAAGDQGCCRNDADCDDGDSCTVDVCVPMKGCTHEAVGLDLVRGDIESALAVEACAAEPVPARITGLLKRARALIERAATMPADSQAPLIESARQRLTESAQRSAGPALHGRLTAA